MGHTGSPGGANTPNGTPGSEGGISDRHNVGVATATTVDTGHAHPSVNRPNLTSVGTIIWLSSELMFFAALFAMYFTLRSVTGPDFWSEKADLLNFPFSATNTTILVLSSLTCQLGVFAAERGDVKKLRGWFIVTFIMGAVFIGGQVFEYTELVKHEGLSSPPTRTARPST